MLVHQEKIASVTKTRVGITPSGNEGSDTENLAVTTSINKKEADDIDKNGLKATERMVNLTDRAIKKAIEDRPISNIQTVGSGLGTRIITTLLADEWSNTSFVYDPTNAFFASNPDVAAFRVGNTTSTTITVGRKILDFADPEMSLTYHGTTVRGGDSGLLFAGLHEFGHIVGRPYANRWLSGNKELFANSFAKQQYPRSLTGTTVDRNLINFP